VVSCVKIEDEKNSNSRYEVILEDTILFPEGGGQPCDFGYLNDKYVTNVIRKGAIAVHYVEAEEKPFETGLVVQQKVDWERRTDNMQQHSGNKQHIRMLSICADFFFVLFSGQHLISALFETEYNIPTKSWWLGNETSYVELDAKDVTQAQIDGIESICNAAISKAMPVTVAVYDMNDPALSADVRILSHSRKFT
jgi:misacylated tRNA(Ala) deacylase